MGKFGKENFDESNNWRVYCVKAFNECITDYAITTVNPNNFFNFLDEPEYESHAEVMDFDLFKLRRADLLLVNFNDPQSLGSMSEMAIAYDRRIPIIGINESGYELHPWQTAMCERIFNTIDKALDYIEDFYLTD